MKRHLQRGYTLVELVTILGLFGLFLGSLALLGVIIHFIIKLW